MISALGAPPAALHVAASKPQQAEQNEPVQKNPAESLIAAIEENDNNSSALLGRLSSGTKSVLLQAQEDETNAEGLTEEEEELIEELQQTDQEVRTHEQAHKSAAGPYGGAISYETQTGPDGREYAIGGHVQIDTSPVPGNPEATIRKADIVERAALAPAQPSSEDFAVARAAQTMRQQAQAELSKQREAERNGEEDSEDADTITQLTTASEEEEEEEEESGSAANNTLAFADTETILSTVNKLA